MAERNEGERIKNDEPGVLPIVESPPLSPAGASSEEPAEAEVPADAEAGAEADTPAASESETGASETAAPRARFQLSRRNRRRVTMAAWVALIAGFGALFGGAISNGLTHHRNAERASAEQRKAMQQSIDSLSKQVAALKEKLAAAVAQTRVAKAAAPSDSKTGSDITGSIPKARAEPVPLPRPAPRVAAAPSRPAIVPSWRIVRARGGMIDVEGRDGIYEVVIGAVLPGLGPVQAIERRNGRWVVATPKGLIVSSRDRDYFEDF